MLNSFRRRRQREAGTSSRFRLLPLIAAAGITASCDRADVQAAGSGAVRDSAGVMIADIRGRDQPFGLEAVPVAELAPPDSSLTVVPWGVSADPASGRVYALDWNSPRLAAFDREGHYLGDFGRPGSGPGEFRNPVATSLESDGTLVVWDVGRSMLSRWSPTGELIGEERTPAPYWGPGFAVMGDAIVTVTSEESPSRTAVTQRLVAVSSAGERTLFELPVELGVMRLGGSAMPAPKVFSPTLTWTARGDRAYVLNGPEYRIDVYEDGHWVSSIRRDVSPIPVSREMAVEAVESGPGPFGPFMRRAGVTAEQIVNAVGREEVTSPVQAIGVDPEGRLWVTRTSDGIRPSRIDVLDAEGAYLGSFAAPGVPVAFLSPSEFVSLQVEEETGLARFILHRLAEADASDH